MQRKKKSIEADPEMIDITEFIDKNIKTVIMVFHISKKVKIKHVK